MSGEDNKDGLLRAAKRASVDPSDERAKEALVRAVYFAIHDDWRCQQYVQHHDVDLVKTVRKAAGWLMKLALAGELKSEQHAIGCCRNVARSAWLDTRKKPENRNWYQRAKLPAGKQEPSQLEQIYLQQVTEYARRNRNVRAALWRAHGYTWAEVGELEECEAETARKRAKAGLHKLRILLGLASKETR